LALDLARSDYRGHFVSNSHIALGDFSKVFTEPDDPRAGERIENGPFVYTVEGVDCMASTPGNPSAEQQYVVAVAVLNVSSNADKSVPTNWRLDGPAKGYAASDWSGPGFDRLFPGQGEVGQITFEIPSQVTPTSLLVAPIGEDSVRVIL
jgi:hypothetical protein